MKAIPYPVTITPDAADGFIVQVGCQTFAYTDAAKLSADLGFYLREPEAAVEDHRRRHEPWQSVAGQPDEDVPHYPPGGATDAEDQRSPRETARGRSVRERLFPNTAVIGR